MKAFLEIVKIDVMDVITTSGGCTADNCPNDANPCPDDWS